MKKHKILGMVELKWEVDKETGCSDCAHYRVCDRNMEKRCVNFRYGDSRYSGCESCSHHFTRWADDAVPCFVCEDFVARHKED